MFDFKEYKSLNSGQVARFTRFTGSSEIMHETESHFEDTHKISVLDINGEKWFFLNQFSRWKNFNGDNCNPIKVINLINKGILEKGGVMVCEDSVFIMNHITHTYCYDDGAHGYPSSVVLVNKLNLILYFNFLIEGCLKSTNPFLSEIQRIKMVYNLYRPHIYK